MTACGCQPIACDLSVFTPQERTEHFARGKRIFAFARIDELSDGYAFTWTDARAELETWIDEEKRCCPFFEFDLTRTSSETKLAITGPLEAKAILRAALSGASP